MKSVGCENGTTIMRITMEIKPKRKKKIVI